MTSESESNVDELDATVVANWLDNHPDFLNDYLKKIQIQRRSSIMNDRSSLLLANISSNIRNSSSSNISHLNNVSHSFVAGSNLDRSFTLNDSSANSCPWSSLAPSLSCITPTRNYKNSIHSLIGFNSHNLNASFSEPNLPTESNSLLNISSVPSKRKNFKKLGIYEKMYTLVKTLYESLDLKSTCKKILNTVSLLLDADRCSLFLVVDDDEAETKKCLVSVYFLSIEILVKQLNLELMLVVILSFEESIYLGVLSLFLSNLLVKLQIKLANLI